MIRTKTSAFIEAAFSADTDDCIEWPFATTNEYPYAVINGKRGYVHRHMCVLKYGPPPSRRHQAAHGCNNPPCINWRHLRWATPKQNQHDRLAAGTGERGRRYLDEKKVRWIWAERNNITRAEMARQLGVHRATIGAVLDGKTYRQWANCPKPRR